MKKIKKMIEAFYLGVKVKILKPVNLKKENFGEGLDAFGNKTYDAPKIINFLKSIKPSNSFCLLALTDLFLYHISKSK